MLISLAMILVFAADFATSAALALASSECRVPPRVIVFLSLSSATVTSFRSACCRAFSTLSLYDKSLRLEHARPTDRAVSTNRIAKRFISGLLAYSITSWLAKYPATTDVAGYCRSAKPPEWWRSFGQRLRRSKQCPAPPCLQGLLSLALPPLSCLSERKAEFLHL